MIDGAGYPTIATRIVLPLSKAVTATIALWTAVAHWNEWFFAMLFIDGRDTQRNTPVRNLRVPAGRHVLGLRTSDGTMHRFNITVEPDSTQRFVRQL